MQLGALLVVEVVAAAGEDLVERHELDDLALGQVGGFVEHEASVVHVGLERLHCVQSNAPRSPPRVWPSCSAVRLRGSSGN
jgi:hypothetical protein